MIFHHNFGVSEHDDPYEFVLHHTVANLKHPPRVPSEDEPEKTSAAQLVSTKRINPSLGVPRTEGYTEG